MGELSITTGRILTISKDDHLKNLEILSALPAQNDGYALFTREMFCQNALPGKGSFVTGFARSYKNIEHSWKDWIGEFEDLLRQLKWESVNVFLETEMFGTHQYMWQNKHYSNSGSKRENNYGLIEKEEWYFGKGHRNFWGMERAYGWEQKQEEIRTLYQLSESIDNSLMGNPSKIKLIKTEKGEYEIVGSANGVKKLVSNLIKLYLSEQQRHGDFNSSFKIDQPESLFHEDSPVRISRLGISEGVSNTGWIYDFVEKMAQPGE